MKNREVGPVFQFGKGTISNGELNIVDFIIAVFISNKNTEFDK